VGADHCDVSAILKELHLLRYEVRMMSQLKDEMDDLKKEVATLRSAHTDQATAVTNNWPQLSDGSAPNLSELREEVKMLKCLLHDSCPTPVDPATDEEESLSTGKSFADTARKLTGDTNAFKNQPSRKRKQPRKLVVGESTANKHVQSVSTVRTVDIFVSRLHPATCEDDLVKCVDSMKGDIDVKDVVCTRLKS